MLQVRSIRALPGLVDGCFAIKASLIYKKKRKNKIKPSDDHTKHML